jgi:predicted SprT family Zn-dependent metalloprotease
MRGVHYMLNKKLTEVCGEYGVPVPVLVLSTMKSKNGTFGYSYDRKLFKTAKTPDEILKATYNRTIKVSKYLYEMFGYKRAEETLCHEIAHYLDMLFNKKSYDINSHGNTFKEICVSLGGTMNSHHATGIYSVASSADFVAHKVGYMYTCPCGEAKRKTIRKISEKVLKRSYCTICNTRMINFKVDELG